MFHISMNVFFRVLIVSSLDCVCAHASAVPPSLTSYDGLKLAITRPQKTVLSQWGNGTKDPCKFAIVARSFDTYNDKSVRLFVEWMAINIGLFSKSHRTDKFARSYQVKHGNVYVRGQNTKDEDGPLSLPHNWLSDDESTDIMITKEGKKVFFRSTRCPYGLDVRQSGRITKSYRIYTGDHFQDGKMDGMCGDCNGNEEDDMRKCGGLGTASGDDDVTQSCEKAYLMMVG